MTKYQKWVKLNARYFNSKSYDQREKIEIQIENLIIKHFNITIETYDNDQAWWESMFVKETMKVAE